MNKMKIYHSIIYSVSDDENFQDDIMSNPDGYEETGYVTKNNSQSQISPIYG